MKTPMKAADAVKILLDKPYEAGGFEDGVDCLSLIILFYELQGIKMPDEWHGWTRENYAECWDNGKGWKELYDFLCTLGSEVENQNFIQVGDLVILNVVIDNGLEIKMPAIYLGNGHIFLVMIETGATVIPIWAVKSKIHEVRRIG